MENNNPNNLQVGDEIMVEQAWEDEAGGDHAELAVITAIDEKGELSLEWPYASKEIQEFLADSDGYLAKDFKPETNPQG